MGCVEMHNEYKVKAGEVVVLVCGDNEFHNTADRLASIIFI